VDYSELHSSKQSLIGKVLRLFRLSWRYFQE